MYIKTKRIIVKKFAHSQQTPMNPLPICTKFGTAGRLADLITDDNFFVNRLRCFESVRGRIFPFSYPPAIAVNTVLALPRSL